MRFEWIKVHGRKRRWALELDGGQVLENVVLDGEVAKVDAGGAWVYVLVADIQACEEKWLGYNVSVRHQSIGRNYEPRCMLQIRQTRDQSTI